MWPTPVSHDDNKSPEAHLAMKQRMKGGPRTTITSLSVAVKAAERLLPTPHAIYGEHPGMTDPSHLTGAALLPTPRASPSHAEGREAGIRHKEKWGSQTLATAAKMLPTPRAEGQDAGAHRGRPDSLHALVKGHPEGTPMLPSPAASDHKGSSRPGQRRGHLSEVVAGQMLNPAWVQRMMGYPDGWMADLPADPLAHVTR